MTPSSRALVGLILHFFWTCLISASPLSQSASAESAGSVCIQESDFDNMKRVVDEQKKHYLALNSQVCQLTNHQADNTSTANQDAKDINSLTNHDAALSAWMDLYQLHLYVHTLFGNYTTWLEKSTTQETKMTLSNPETDMKAMAFSLWLQMQESNGRIRKLEQMHKKSQRVDYQSGEKESYPTRGANEVELPNNMPFLGEQSKSIHNSEQPSNDIRHKLNTIPDKESKIFPNDLHSLQGQLRDLNDTVQSLVLKMTHLERETASPSAESLFGALAKQQQSITNETCNGSRRHLVGSSCYFIPQIYESEQMFTWWDARYFCKQPEVLGQDGDLAVIDSKQEMDAIRHMLTNHFGGIEAFWIGATDIDKEGHWIWVPSNTPLSSGTSFWAEDPHHDTLTNCAAMEQGYQWLPEPCYYERVPLCELQL